MLNVQWTKFGGQVQQSWYVGSGTQAHLSAGSGSPGTSNQWSCPGGHVQHVIFTVFSVGTGVVTGQLILQRLHGSPATLITPHLQSASVTTGHVGVAVVVCTAGFTVEGFGVVGGTVVGLAVVGAAVVVVGFAVVGASVVVVGLAVVGAAVVVVGF
jgi:hypothetical protein